MSKTKNNKINFQTYLDLGMWLTNPNRCSEQQIKNLLDDDKRLPLIELTNKFWLIGALTNSLKNHYIWNILDKELTNYLLEIESFYFNRSESIKSEAIYVCNLLKEEDVDCCILKGGAQLFNGVASPVSIRFMTDIDILIPHQNIEKARAILFDKGFKNHGQKFDEKDVVHHHLNAIYRNGGACCIELHSDVVKLIHKKIINTDEAWAKIIPLKLTSHLATSQLSPEHQIIHAITHSELGDGDFASRDINLRYLFNLHTIIRSQTETIDWGQINEHFIRMESEDFLPSYLNVYSRLFNVAFPYNIKITKNQNSHFIKCKENINNKSIIKNLLHQLTLLFKGYSEDNIILVYGGEGIFSIFKGRFKLFKHQFKMLRMKDFRNMFWNKIKK